jgi:CDP-glycerol glycerophosphotransferase
VLASTVRTLLRAPAFLLSYVGRRDRRTWAFGNVHGFRDSPRYLAEHVLHSSLHVEVYWIAHTQEEAEAAMAAGLNVAVRGTPEARRIQRRAGVAFFTHGFRDLDLAFVVGAHLVYLWHGKSLKIVGLDASALIARRRPLPVRVAARLAQWFKARAFSFVSIFVASGEHEKERFLTAFRADPSRVRVLGSARFDVIRGGPAYHRVVGDGDLRARLGYNADDRIVLWLPTHRQEYGGDAPWLPALGREAIEESLASTNITLLVKTHPNADIEVYRERLPDHRRVRLLDESEVDVNCLLHISDALVSDYSSVVFDYSILGRPIHFMAPDIETYSARRGLYEPYETLSAGRHHRDWSSLLEELRAEAAGDGERVGEMLSRRVSDYCRNNLEPETCQRITQAVMELALPRTDATA